MDSDELMYLKQIRQSLRRLNADQTLLLSDLHESCLVHDGDLGLACTQTQPTMPKSSSRGHVIGTRAEHISGGLQRKHSEGRWLSPSEYQKKTGRPGRKNPW